ncbi:NAD-dependent epimerase/dehydratase family protein [Acidisphaera sp. S103]|uniref:NAD-dependent epimerase/dehydratase family protein n=1 Tax=Acidisphaera sp. S103 TaxID=1747223 RepID=UPI00131C8938|nr:NAD-dependent epimerase/dehydratase family protein [Acidisphaera sp. S103]
MKIAGGKFAITGGVSLIGASVAEQLLEAGARQVVLFDNYSLSSPDMVQGIIHDGRIKLIRGDILRTNELFDAFEDVQGVFAIAGFLTLPLTLNPMLGIAVNVQGMVNVHEVCRYRNVEKVVFSSSVATYGETEAETTQETDPWAWSKQQPGAALYGASKLMGENIGRLYEDRYGVKSISLRYSSVYGERQHYRAINSIYIIDTYDRIKRGERPIIPDDGLEVHDYIHVADIARANLMAMESDVSRESFNVATGVSTTLNRLVEIILQVTGSDLEPEYKTIPGKIRATTSKTLKFSNRKIERMIGWRPGISIEEGIERVIRWCQTQP